MPIRPEDLLQQAINKASRHQMSPIASVAIASSYRLLPVLLREIKDHYVTLPATVRAAVEEFVRG